MTTTVESSPTLMAVSSDARRCCCDWEAGVLALLLDRARLRCPITGGGVSWITTLDRFWWYASSASSNAVKLFFFFERGIHTNMPGCEKRQRTIKSENPMFKLVPFYSYIESVSSFALGNHCGSMILWRRCCGYLNDAMVKWQKWNKYLIEQIN